jgi:hypothetical protein
VFVVYAVDDFILIRYMPAAVGLAEIATEMWLMRFLIAKEQAA